MGNPNYKIDNGDGSPVVSDEELRAFDRQYAAILRKRADTAPTIEERIFLLETADKWERLAETQFPFVAR